MKVNLISKYLKNTGKKNMELDLAMLNSATESKEGELFLRFYGWKPKCVSLGRNQKEFEIPKGIDIVRRPTGGRALLHDDEITYAVAGKIPDKQSVIETYRMISGAIIKGFKEFGIELELAGERGGNKAYCMNISSGADICYKGKKFTGSAQFRSQGCFLQHGSIVKSLNYELLEEIFKEKIDRTKIVTLSEINPEIKDEDIIIAIENAMKEI